MHQPSQYSRKKSFAPPVSIFIGLAVGVFMLYIGFVSIDHFRQDTAASRREAAAESIKKRGGLLLYDPADSTSVVSIDLSNADVDSQLLQRIAQFDRIERLKLNGAKLPSDGLGILDALTRLVHLSLNASNLTDAQVESIPKHLKQLSLHGTSIGDRSISVLAQMHNLSALDISGTLVSAEGLQRLRPLESLKRLKIDERCVDMESARVLRDLQLESVEVQVTVDKGKRPYQILSQLMVPNVRGTDADSAILWRSEEQWSHSLAGVVEAVALECRLEPKEIERLVQVLAISGDLRPTNLESQLDVAAFSIATNATGSTQASETSEIQSSNEFFDELLKSPFASPNESIRLESIRRFAREEFTVANIPELLAAIQAAPESNDDRVTLLCMYGPFLLIEYGIDLQEVRTELESIMTDGSGFLRINTICAFSGTNPLYSRNEWTPSKAADAFAVPILIKICEDSAHQGTHAGDALVVLAEISYRRPEYTSRVIPILVDSIVSGPVSLTLISFRLERISKFAPDIALAMVPKLRAALESLDLELAEQELSSAIDQDGIVHRRRAAVLEALSATASMSPEVSKEIALAYLDRMRKSKSVGPFAPLLKPENWEVNREVILELLASPQVPDERLTEAVKAIAQFGQ